MYNINNKSNADNQLTYFSNLKTIDIVIEKATFSIDSRNKRFHHQKRISLSILDSVYNKLNKRKIELSKCVDFDSVYKIVMESRVKGFGDLCVYDTSLRIASYLGIRPDKIYLHAGTLKGAKKIGIKTNGKKYLLISDLPNEFNNIECYNIEDILCIYKDKF